MFRKIAIALVAASALGAPVLAQQTTTTPNESKLSPSTSAPTATTPETTEKTVTKGTKHAVARHHRNAKMAKYGKAHGSKMAKYGKAHGSKMAKYGRSGKSGAKYGKYTRHMGHPSTYGKAMSSKPGKARPGLD